VAFVAWGTWDKTGLIFLTHHYKGWAGKKLMSTNIKLPNRQTSYNKNLAIAKLAVKYCNDAVQFIDRLGNSTYHNQAFINLLGYSTEQINSAGGPYSVFADPDIPNKIMAHFDQKEHWEGNVELFNNIGKRIQFFLIITAVKNFNHEVITFICIYRTIDNSKTTDNDNEPFLKKIEEAEKLARLGYFSSAISHEINNPLSIVQTKLFFLKRRLAQVYPQKNDESWEYIEKIDQQVLRLSNLANSILQYAKHRVKKDFLVNVNQVLMQTVSSFKEIIPASIKLKIDLEPALYLIPADETGLEIVFKNIILNAVEALVANGEIIIKTKNFSDKFIEIIISDTGVGIPEETLSRIFNPFYTNKKKSGCYGLGLSLCENIISEHNGQISVNSKENVGTEFSIHLPCI